MRFSSLLSFAMPIAVIVSMSALGQDGEEEPVTLTGEPQWRVNCSVMPEACEDEHATPVDPLRTVPLEESAGDTPGDNLGAGHFAPSAVIPALPGLKGFDMSNSGVPAPTYDSALRALMSERIDFEWAREMESKALSEVVSVIDTSTSVVDIQCRATWCGLVATTDDRGVRWAIRDHLREVFDIRYTSSHGRGWSNDGHGGWIAVYFQFER